VEQSLEERSQLESVEQSLEEMEETSEHPLDEQEPKVEMKWDESLKDEIPSHRQTGLKPSQVGWYPQSEAAGITSPFIRTTRSTSFCCRDSAAFLLMRLITSAVALAGVEIKPQS
jgi:hypothetical protein